MRRITPRLLVFPVVLAALALTPLSRAAGLSAEEIMEKYHLVYYYAAEDGRAAVHMKLINKQGKTRERYFTMLRRDVEEGGRQKYFVYFHRPGDVRGTVFMVHKHPGKDDDRWLYIPAINLTKRIAANDKRSSFMGSDYTYEDVSGRNPADDDHELLKEEALDGKQAYLIKSVPKNRSNADFAYRLIWVDKESYLPLKEEYYNRRQELYKVFTADKIDEIEGILTVTARTMKNLETGHRTEVSFESIDYNAGLTDDVFSQRYFKNPPRKWIKK